MGGRLSMHFGHCDQFALVDVDEGQVVNTTYVASPPHQPGALPRWLHEQNAELIIAAGIGRRAQQLFAEQGIRVVVGAPADPPEAVVAAYLNGSLAMGENVCDH
jgi:predicted Fe-Mo cluster-binding NifX family protein